LFLILRSDPEFPGIYIKRKFKYLVEFFIAAPPCLKRGYPGGGWYTGGYTKTDNYEDIKLQKTILYPSIKDTVKSIVS
jgi:hypothetical protein